MYRTVDSDEDNRVTHFQRLNAKNRQKQKGYPCGVSAFPHTLKRPLPRIINGWEARPHSFPWIVAIFYKNNDLSVHCGGSVIDLQKKNYSNLVLTATHCFATGKRFDKPSDYYVVAGLHDISKQDDITVQRSKVAKYLRLDFINGVFQNDVSVVILEQPLQFTQYVRPICLPKPCGTSAPSAGCVVAGWGLQNEEYAGIHP
ncbi:hypothetical protein D918_02643 [Trichuris suis]|nr:hypothetical protein D918_02643 [Trichuris suis]